MLAHRLLVGAAACLAATAIGPGGGHADPRPSVAQGPPAALAPAPAPPAAPSLAGALVVSGDADVVVIDLPVPSGAPHVRAATLVQAPPAAVTAVLLDPAHYRALIPALIRSDVEGSVPGTNARQIAWELEVPLFNLSGHLVLRPIPGGVELVLHDGDLPGRVAFHAWPAPGGRTTLEIDAQIDVRRSSWFLRRVMARSPFGEPAALAAAAWVALRATALRAEHRDAPAAWRPSAPPVPPPTWRADGRALTDARLAPLRARGALALVARGESGRLAGVAVAVPVNAPADTLAGALRDPQSWRAFPGWKKVIPLPPTGPAAPPSAMVEDSIPFVDLDATWQAAGDASLRWTAVDGAARGARLGWDVAADGPTSAVAVLTLYPRLEATGSIPRRLIDAEPLLEHGMSLSLAFVDAVSAARAAASRAAASRAPASR
jgi:hypothetical protein